MRKIKVAELIFDYTIYPRAHIDSQHAHYIAEAVKAGTSIPPVIVEEGTLRIIDGFHRATAFRRLKIDEIEVIEKRYKSDKDLFLDCIRYNASHGKSLNTFDRTHCILKAHSLSINNKLLASALSVPLETVVGLTTHRMGKLKADTPIPLKRTISHMAGQKLTTEQAATNDKLGGMRQEFYINQVILLLESGLINLEVPSVVDRLATLKHLLNKI